MSTIHRSAVCEHMLIASTSPHTINRYPYHAQMRAWVYLVVLTLTLFNPLACLIHCHVMHQQHASPMTMYVCDMGTTMMATHQHDLQSVPSPTINAPQAYYAGVLMSIPELVLLPVTAILARVFVLTWHSHPIPPLTPPPQTY